MILLSLNSYSQNKPFYPKPKEGYKRVDLLLPKIENEQNFKVEIKFSFEGSIVECAKAGFGFNFNKNLKEGFGIGNSRYPFYSVENDMVDIFESRNSDCKSETKIIKKIFSSQNFLIEYQSYYARPFYIPENWNLEYRIWSVTSDNYISVNK